MATHRKTARKQPLRGRYYVYPTGTAIRRTWGLFKGKARPVYILRRHTLKLMYYPGGNPDQKIMDLNWDWIDGTGQAGIGELRIEETIGGYDNLRVIFFVAARALKGEPLPRIWIMSAFQKKTERFSANELRAFTAGKKLIIKRFYADDG